MLGGSVYIALIRFVISLAGVMLLYSILSESRFSTKKTVLYYSCFAVVMTAISCMWYVANQPLYVRVGPHTMYLGYAFFAFWCSKGSVWVKVYKLVFVFYLMAVYIVGSIEIAIFFFGHSIWADMFMRLFLLSLFAFLLEKYMRKDMEGFGDYVERETDRVSVITMIICSLFGIGYIMNPSLNRNMNFSRIFQIVTNFLLIGTLQFLVFRFYLHIGKEKEYERENQLVQMNNRLLERQLETLEESLETGRRIRHDVRHHIAVIAEFTRRGQRKELLQYLKEYDQETGRGMVEKVCDNTAVNNLLAAYTRKARNEQIRVTLKVDLDRELTIPSIDLVTILANAYENAIFACMEAKKQEGRECFIHLTLKKKKNKLIISCKNTCRMETEMKDGQPKAEFTGGIGVLSIIKTAEKYEGEYDFRNDNGVFVFRLIMSIPRMLQDLCGTEIERKGYVSDSAL